MHGRGSVTFDPVQAETSVSKKLMIIHNQSLEGSSYWSLHYRARGNEHHHAFYVLANWWLISLISFACFHVICLWWQYDFVILKMACFCCNHIIRIHLKSLSYKIVTFSYEIGLSNLVNKVTNQYQGCKGTDNMIQQTYSILIHCQTHCCLIVLAHQWGRATCW